MDMGPVIVIEIRRHSVCVPASARWDRIRSLPESNVRRTPECRETFVSGIYHITARHPVRDMDTPLLLLCSSFFLAVRCQLCGHAMHIATPISPRISHIVSTSDSILLCGMLVRSFTILLGGMKFFSACAACNIFRELCLQIFVQTSSHLSVSDPYFLPILVDTCLVYRTHIKQCFGFRKNQYHLQ